MKTMVLLKIISCWLRWKLVGLLDFIALTVAAVLTPITVSQLDIIVKF